jgi:hypothetical protein
MAHASSANADVAAREGGPGRHAPAAWNLAATTDDESYHGSTSELPRATSHGYAEWDFSGVPDPVMFQRFLDAADYGSVTLTTPAAGAMTPRGSALSCLPTTKQTLRTRRKPATKRFSPTRELDRTRVRGRARLPPHRQGVPTSTRSWLKRANSRPNSRRSTAWCSYFEPPSAGKPQRAVSVRASWASKPVSASTPTSMSTTQAHPRE